MEIKQDEGQQRFYTKVNGEEAFTAYTKNGKAIDFHHTFVPEKLRNKGLAGKIVAAALENARKNDLQVTASCSFVEQFIKDNPEYQDLLKK